MKCDPAKPAVLKVIPIGADGGVPPPGRGVVTTSDKVTGVIKRGHPHAVVTYCPPPVLPGVSPATANAQGAAADEEDPCGHQTTEAVTAVASQKSARHRGHAARGGASAGADWPGQNNDAAARDMAR